MPLVYIKKILNQMRYKGIESWKKSVLGEKKYNELYNNINEENKQYRPYAKLLNILDNAISAAEDLYDKGNPGDVFDGDEGNHISEKLREIWSAFSTGKRKDHSRDDEIFKN